jgi:GNAT superfamily N-acetyltransferase
VTEGAPTRIRKATEDDIPRLLDCLQVVFAPYRDSYTPGAFLDTVLTETTARERLRAMAVFVAVDPSDTVVGTVAAARVSASEGHLRGMAVRPEAQGSGVATELLHRALGYLASIGCRRVTLGTTAPLVRASRFYERNGFHRSGRMTDFHGMELHEYVREL